MVYGNHGRVENGSSNVAMRGLDDFGRELRPAARLAAGRWYTPGRREITVSRTIASRFRDCALGDELVTGKLRWSVVGIFDAGHSAYSSEIWTSADDIASAFHRNVYSDVLMRAAGADAERALIAQLAGDPRIRLDARSLAVIPLTGLTTGTTNWLSFSEMSFQFAVTPALIARGVAFAAVMGVAGGILPALRASRLSPAQAMRAL